MQVKLKQVAKLMGRTRKYAARLLRHKKLSANQIDYYDLVAFVEKNRYGTYRGYRDGKVIGRVRMWRKRPATASIKQLIDKIIFGELYQTCRGLYQNACAACGAKGEHVHHIDGNHTNMTIDNLMLLCFKCHWQTHHQMQRRKAA